MSAFQSQFLGIVGALAVAFIGLLSVAVSLVRRKGGDRSLIAFGFLGLIYGLQWLVQSTAVRTALGYPFDLPYLHAVLTYLLPIPLGAFLLEVFGPGILNSLRLTYCSMIAFAGGAIAFDVATVATGSDRNIPFMLVIVWCAVGFVNLSFPKRREPIDLLVVRSSLLVLFAAITHDNLGGLGFMSHWPNLTNAGFVLLCFGLGFVAVQHFVLNERALLAVEQELAIARQIQQSNLPSTLTVPDGVSIAARYIPMTAVAGDFYDVHVDERGGVGILIADVSGHGIGAALIASMLKVGFAAQSLHISEPGRLLTGLNWILQGKVRDCFVTACAVYINPGGLRLRYANAGHPAPMVLRRNGAGVDDLPGGGMILGPFPEASYESQEAPLFRGDRLLLYTDGLLEARDKNAEEFGEGRLRTALRELSTKNSTELALSSLVERLMTWTGKRSDTAPDDDLTLLLVDVGGSGHELS